MELSSGGEGLPCHKPLPGVRATIPAKHCWAPSLGWRTHPKPWNREESSSTEPWKSRKSSFIWGVFFLQRSIKIAQGVMLSLHQDGLDLVLVHSGWKVRESGSSHLLLGPPTSHFTNSGYSLWKRPGLLILFFNNKKDLNHQKLLKLISGWRNRVSWFQPLHRNVRDASMGQFGNAQFGQLRAILL